MPVQAHRFVQRVSETASEGRPALIMEVHRRTPSESSQALAVRARELVAAGADVLLVRCALQKRTVLVSKPKWTFLLSTHASCNLKSGTFMLQMSKCGATKAYQGFLLKAVILCDSVEQTWRTRRRGWRTFGPSAGRCPARLSCGETGSYTPYRRA